MKKIMAILIAVVVIACATVMTVSASNYDFYAEELNALGLLQGTDAGFDLDRTPTRIEALVMLIRLYGLEDEALACDHENPFTDVAVWANKYVSYAYENGLTTGMSETAFGSETDCSAQMYVTFILRALGYSDADGDFSYEEALDFGKTVNVTDELLADGEFLRGHMAAMSYLALSAQPKDGDFATLLDKLTDGEAVPPAAAESLQNRIKLYDEFSKLGEELNDEKKISITGVVDAEASFMGEAMAISLDMDMDMIMEDDNIIASVLMDLTADGETISVEYYISGDYVYLNADGEKIRLNMGISELLASLGAQETSTASTLYLIKDITKSTADGFTVYKAELASGFINAIVEQVMSLTGGDMIMESGLSGINFGDFIIEAYADENGALKKMGMYIDMTIGMSMEGSSITVPAEISMELEIIAVGDDVTVTLPADLDDYIEFEMPV